MKRVLQTRRFARWCTLSEDRLCAAAREIERGQYEADLGRGVVKKRVAYPGRGKSGSARVLVAQRVKDFIIFLVGRDKRDPGKDFSAAQEEAAKELAAAYEKLGARGMALAIDADVLKEICHDDQNEIRA